jgi:hypothetical protein
VWSASRPGHPYPREGPVTHCTGGWVGPRAGLDRCGKSHPTGIRSPDLPARSESLYRLGAIHKLRDIYESFCVSLHENFNTYIFAKKVLKAFGSTEMCEETLSVKNFRKRKFCSRLTDERLHVMERESCLPHIPKPIFTSQRGKPNHRIQATEYDKTVQCFCQRLYSLI